MKLFLRQLFSFAFVTLPFYALAVVIWGYTMAPRVESNISLKRGAYGHMFSRMQEAKQVNGVDVLFLGSSHAYRGFDPRIFSEHSMTSFNLGSSSQTPIQTKMLLQRYLKKIRPKLIVFEVYPATMNLDGVESALDVVSNDEVDVFAWQMAARVNHVTVYNTLVYYTIMNALGLDSFDHELAVKGYDTYVSGGFVEKKLKHYVHDKGKPKEWELDDKQIDAFEDCLDMIRYEGVEVILVNAPIAPSFYEEYTNNADFDQRMRSYGSYINFNEKLQLSDSLHFFDAHHLNQNGVEIFNEAVITMLHDRG